MSLSPSCLILIVRRRPAAGIEKGEIDANRGRVRVPGEDIAKYHKVFEVGGAPITDQPKRLSHICYEDDGGFTVVDVWEDEASFAAFGEVIGPATAKAGLDAKPRVHKLEASLSQEGVWTTY